MARIESVINTMNLQYESEVGISHSITTILVRTTSNDPYSSSDAVTLLNQFRNHWNSSQGSIQRDVAAVDREPGIHRQLQFLVEATDNRLRTRPEQTMVNDQ